jgi:hypothetical protein
VPPKNKTNKKEKQAGHWSLTSIILTTWEAEIGRIVVQGQSRQIVLKMPSPK